MVSTKLLKKPIRLKRSYVKNNKVPMILKVYSRKRIRRFPKRLKKIRI